MNGVNDDRSYGHTSWRQIKPRGIAGKGEGMRWLKGASSDVWARGRGKSGLPFHLERSTIPYDDLNAQLAFALVLPIYSRRTIIIYA